MVSPDNQPHIHRFIFPANKGEDFLTGHCACGATSTPHRNIWSLEEGPGEVATKVSKRRGKSLQINSHIHQHYQPEKF